MTLSRRSLFGGLIALAAPAIIRTPGLLMPIRAIRKPPLLPSFVPTIGQYLIPANLVKQIGQGNSSAGHAAIEQYLKVLNDDIAKNLKRHGSMVAQVGYRMIADVADPS